MYLAYGQSLVVLLLHIAYVWSEFYLRSWKVSRSLKFHIPERVRTLCCFKGKFCSSDISDSIKCIFFIGTTIFPWHNLPNLDQIHIYAISKVIILNKDQHHKTIYQQTTGLIQRLGNISHLLSIGVIVAKKFCLRKCVCLLFTRLSCMEYNFLPNR